MADRVAEIRKWLGTGSINIFGMPYAGKDTQGGILADLLGGHLLGGGQILRNSIIPPHVREIMELGNLIPTEDYLRIVLPYLSSDKFLGKPLILSSVGRWHGEEDGVMAAAAGADHSLRAVIYLAVPDEVTKQRKKLFGEADRGNRADDNPELFDSRLQEFRTKTLPVIDYYRQKGLLIEVDASHEPPQVTEQILAALHALATQSSPDNP